MDNFAEYAEFVAYVAKGMRSDYKAKFSKFDEWAVAWRRLYDSFDQRYKADPMLVYRPKHEVAYQFHSSPAFIRYFRAGNRTSKTQSGYAEHYFHVTGNHPYRKSPTGHTFLIGLQYSTYAGQVFEQKMLTGESNNPVSPMFPIGGKWFNHYDDRKHVITIACRECAEVGKAGVCRHSGKNTIKLMSDEIGWEQLQGAVYVFGHFDEHISEGWFDEAKVRFTGIPNAGLIITGTPLFGPLMWENTRVASVVEENPALNRINVANPASPPLVSMHEISMRHAGIATDDEIARMSAGWDEMTILARIDGKPAPTTKNPVFDRFILVEMRKAAKEPKYHRLDITKPELEEVANHHDIKAEILPAPQKPKEHTGLRVWEMPDPNGQYIISVDSARGVTGRDASCASVLRLENRGRRLHLNLVAQYHGWLNGFSYAEEVFKLAVWYHDALVIVELTGGFGDAVILRLKQLTYWNIYREMGKRVNAEFTEDVRFGVDTNASTKGFMVTALQQFVRDRCITIPCRDTIDEMLSFAQEDTSKEGIRLVTPRFQGAGGSRDDRVMSLVIGASVAVSTPIFDFQKSVTENTPAPVSPTWQQTLKDAASDHQEV